jgi:hypothetical protein
MDAPKDFSRIVDRKKYSTKTATLIAGDDYWDGHNWEHDGRNTFLYRTPKSAYFEVTLTMWQGEQDTLIPLSLDEAIELYEESLTEHYVNYEDAFPDVTIEEA